MSLHLGLHWSMMMGMAKKVIRKPNHTGAWILRGAGFLIAAYGVYAFGKRDIGTYCCYGIVCVGRVLFGEGNKAVQKRERISKIDTVKGGLLEDRRLKAARRGKFALPYEGQSAFYFLV